MVRSKKISQAIILAFTVIALTLGFVDVPADSVGLYEDAGLANRLLYPFFHVSFLHAAINCWCLLSIVFIYDITPMALLVSYLIAAFYPVNTLAFLQTCPFPTLGASGVCYVLLGSISLSVIRKAYYQSCMALFIGLGFFFRDSVNAWLHLYCYLCGLVLAFLNTPVEQWRRK